MTFAIRLGIDSQAVFTLTHVFVSLLKCNGIIWSYVDDFNQEGRGKRDFYPFPS
jgi:hypothetical protein